MASSYCYHGRYHTSVPFALHVNPAPYDSHCSPLERDPAYDQSYDNLHNLHVHVHPAGQILFLSHDQILLWSSLWLNDTCHSHYRVSSDVHHPGNGRTHTESEYSCTCCQHDRLNR